jgi:AraC-like DNA-binding protein
MDVLSDAIATLRVGRPSASRALAGAGGWRFPAYEGAGFHIVLEGRCRLVCAVGEPLTLGTGDAVLLPHGTEHALAFDRVEAPGPAQVAGFPAWQEAAAFSQTLDGQGLSQTLDGQAAVTDVLCGKYRTDRTQAHPLVREMPDVVHVSSRLGRNAELRAAIELLAREAHPARPGADTLVTSLMDAIFVYLVRAWLEQGASVTSSGGSGWRAALQDPVCSAALTAMHTDASRPWSMETLARHAGVSRATLARRFGTLVGQSPMAYLTWWRMATAARLLSTSDMPLAEIATQVGYTSAFAFAHAFKRQFGQAPGRYRQESGPNPNRTTAARA